MSTQRGQSPVAAGQWVAVARALHQYSATRPTELSFSPGDTLFIISKDPSGWWEAQCFGQQGLIPCTFVEEIDFVEENDFVEPTAAAPVPSGKPSAKEKSALKRAVESRKKGISGQGSSSYLMFLRSSLLSNTLFAFGCRGPAESLPYL